MGAASFIGSRRKYINFRCVCLFAVRSCHVHHVFHYHWTSCPSKMHEIVATFPKCALNRQYTKYWRIHSVQYCMYVCMYVSISNGSDIVYIVLNIPCVVITYSTVRKRKSNKHTLYQSHTHRYYCTVRESYRHISFVYRHSNSGCLPSAPATAFVSMWAYITYNSYCSWTWNGLNSLELVSEPCFSSIHTVVLDCTVGRWKNYVL